MGRSVRQGITSLRLESKLTDKEKRQLTKMIARIMEDSYRRGAQQALTLQQYGELKGNIVRIRHDISLDTSPMLENGQPMPGYRNSIDRLMLEYGPYLYDAGITR